MTGAYTPKFHKGMNPSRGATGFTEKWLDRMASRYTIVEVRCSTEPQPEDEPLHVYKRHEPLDTAFQMVRLHLDTLKELGALQPGVWTITIPGTDRKHSFEVE
ncbi:MAG: hypothetical protein ACR2QF_07280 [Geminicoccaceae bacterium]